MIHTSTAIIATPTVATPDAEDQAVGQREADRGEAERRLVIGQRELRLRQDHRGEALERGQQQHAERQHHGDEDVEQAQREQDPGHPPHRHRDAAGTPCR